MNFAFMSFSCPDLNIREMVAAARVYGYTGIEPRLDSGHKHGIEVAAADADIKEAASIAAENDIAICCLATSCRFADPDTYRDNLEQARRVVELAAKVGAPAIRVFGGTIPEGTDRSQSFSQIVASLSSLAEEAQAGGVTLCLETHDAWCDPQQVADIMQAVNHPAIAANWDIMHPVLTAQVSMEKAFEILRPYIRHVHLHDGVRTEGKLVLQPIGQGQVDHKTALNLLQQDGYQGFLSGEWISWEPYEIHLPREIALMKKLVLD